jgi:UDP-N-acetylmuramate--alanine ligase
MKIHFIGIGGIGLSGLARYLKELNHTISGSDLIATAITDNLKMEGISVNIPHNKKYINSQDIIVYSSIIKETNEEIIEAKKRNIKYFSRKEFLPFITGEKKVYSICGAHGKSTTSSILATIMKESSAIIGAEMKHIKSNMVFNQGNSLVFEADESDESFLNSNPHCAIVTNTEPEHMEYYNYDLNRFYGAYRKFIESSTISIVNGQDEWLNNYNKSYVEKLYANRDISNISFFIENSEPYTKFNLRNYGTFCIWGIGEFMAENASLAILSAKNEMDIEEIRANITKFSGIKKRFDIIKKDKYILIDDYAHHPTEIKTTLKSIKKYASLNNISKISAIWQPHKYSRTIDNLENFKLCFDGCDELIILPVWSTGEKEIKINFKNDFKNYNLLMADNIKVEDGDVLIMKDNKVLKYIDNGLIVGFGAGDITYQLRGML